MPHRSFLWYLTDVFFVGVLCVRCAVVTPSVARLFLNIFCFFQSSPTPPWGAASGGLRAYHTAAKELLEASRKGLAGPCW